MIPRTGLLEYRFRLLLATRRLSQFLVERPNILTPADLNQQPFEGGIRRTIVVLDGQQPPLEKNLRIAGARETERPVKLRHALGIDVVDTTEKMQGLLRSPLSNREVLRRQLAG